MVENVLQFSKKKKRVEQHEEICSNAAMQRFSVLL